MATSLWGKLKGLLARGRAVASGGPPPQSVDSYLRDQRNWKPVNSSNVKAVAYHIDVSHFAAGGTLGLQFLNGTTYAYPGQPYSAYVDLLSAASHGQWVWVNLIRKKAKYRRVV